MNLTLFKFKLKSFSCFLLLSIFFAHVLTAYCTDLNLVANEIESNEKVCLLKGYVSKVPSGTKLRIILETPIDEVTNQIDDEVTARIAENVIVGGDILLPAGSTVIGIISEIHPARRLHRAGKIRIEFKNITTPEGKQVPIVASILTRGGLLKGKYTKKTALIAGATLVGPLAAGVGAGLAAEGGPLGATVGGALGALAGIGLFAFQRGNMVDIKAGEELNIELTEEALIPSEEDTLSVKKKEETVSEQEKENREEKDFTEPDSEIISE